MTTVTLTFNDLSLADAAALTNFAQGATMPSTTTEIKFATWTPANVAVGETLTVPLLKPNVGDVLLGLFATVPTPCASGSTANVALTSPGPVVITVYLDGVTWPTPTSGITQALSGLPIPVSDAADLTVTLTYTPGATPGTVTPTVNFYLMAIPGVFGAAG